jgi:3-demethoxyubiquinol 3-hydroxylase
MAIYSLVSRHSRDSSDSIVTSTSPLASPQLTVYFDGACPVCSREIDHYRRQPGAEACAWIDASSCTDDALGHGLTRDAALKRFHVRRADGTLIDGMRGFAALWQALPGSAWLGRIASLGPVAAALEQAYRGFLAVRRLWRPQAAALPWAADIVADLRSDHAGEVGAVQIYRGILAVTRNADLRSFAQHHLATEAEHLRVIATHLSAPHHSKLLPLWRMAGWCTGALPALAGPRAVYATVAAIETFVDRHYAEQIARLDAAPTDARHAALRADLERCRLDELHHRDEALLAGAAQGAVVRCWTGLARHGSSLGVALARRF